MYSRKSVGPVIEHWGTPALIGYSCEDFPFTNTWSHPLLRNEEIRQNIWPNIRLNFMKKSCMPKAVKSLRCVKCYSSSSLSHVKSPINSTRYNCHKICSWLRIPNTILEVWKRPYFTMWSTKLLFTSFFQKLY